MTHYDIVKIKEDGNLEFPSDGAYDIGLVEGSYFLVEISPEVKEARIEQIALPGRSLAEIELIVENKPGVLSNISGIFARHNVNILFNESEETAADEAILILVLDTNKMDIEMSELRSILADRDEVIDISVKHID